MSKGKPLLHEVDELSLVLSELQKQGMNCQGFYLGTLFKTGTKCEKHKYHKVCVVEEK